MLGAISIQPGMTSRSPKISRSEHDSMKPNLISLSQQYVNALRKHLEAGPQAGWQPARELGQQAIALGLETLELARMHDAALVTLELSGQTNAFTKLAGIFLRSQPAD